MIAFLLLEIMLKSLSIKFKKYTSGEPINKSIQIAGNLWDDIGTDLLDFGFI